MSAGHGSPPEGLTASFYMLTGVRIGEPPRFGLAERAAAAAAAGFTGIALAPEELRRARADGADVSDLVATVSAHGLAVPELEPLRGWEESDVASEDELLIYELADAFGATRVNTIQVAGDDADQGLVARRLALVARRAAEHGLTVAFEPRAHSAVASPAAAGVLIELADAPNLAITLDAYHFHRAGICIADLSDLNPELVCSIQLNDMLAEPHGSAVEDALDFRLSPGDGTIDLPAWLGVLRTRGITGPVSVEALSRDLRAMPVDAAARHAASGAHAVLGAVPAD
jgi:sugar phosphate isomerase/epimerase